MKHTASRQRLYAALLGAGACILLFRTTLMIAQGYLGILLPWVAGLLLVELALDLGCLLVSIRWWVAGDKARARLPLRLGAGATILHAVRVLIYALGRTAPLLNFDVRPERRAPVKVPGVCGSPRNVCTAHLRRVHLYAGYIRRVGARAAHRERLQGPGDLALSGGQPSMELAPLYSDRTYWRDCLELREARRESPFRR
jgi:hypothetical protein